jgi:hypothetical protein
LQQTVAFFRVEGQAAAKPRSKAVVAEKPAIRKPVAPKLGNLAFAPSEPDGGSFAKF